MWILYASNVKPLGGGRFKIGKLFKAATFKTKQEAIKEINKDRKMWGKHGIPSSSLKYKLVKKQ